MRLLKMSLRNYMKRHQFPDFFSIHFIIMLFLFPIYFIDYHLNTDFYDGEWENDY